MVFVLFYNTSSRIEKKSITPNILITSYQMYSPSKAFKHVAWISECINRKAEAHYHYEKTDQSERD